MPPPAIEARTITYSLPADGRLDLTPAFARMSAYLDAEMDAMFRTAGASRGHPWAPLAASTLRRKERTGRNPGILIGSSGLLRAGFEAISVGRDRLVYGIRDSLVPHAGYHDSEDARTSSLPMRPLLRIIPRDVETFRALASQTVRDALGGPDGGE